MSFHFSERPLGAGPLGLLVVSVVCVRRTFPLELQAVDSCSMSRFVFALLGGPLLDCQRLCVGVVWSGVLAHNGTHNFSQMPCRVLVESFFNKLPESCLKKKFFFLTATHRR